jgi:hypothetical protein
MQCSVNGALGFIWGSVTGDWEKRITEAENSYRCGFCSFSACCRQGRESNVLGRGICEAIAKNSIVIDYLFQIRRLRIFTSQKQKAAYDAVNLVIHI